MEGPIVGFIQPAQSRDPGLGLSFEQTKARACRLNPGHGIFGQLLGADQSNVVQRGALVIISVGHQQRWPIALRIANMGCALVRQDMLGKVEMRNERSEEHTSELQSLMRISYAVFCLKKITKQ